MSMSLARVGGRADGGVDLLGWWWLPEAGSLGPEPRRRIRVLGQCKAEKKKMGPNYVRELEGVVYKYTSEARRLPDTSSDPKPLAPSSSTLPNFNVEDFLVDLTGHNAFCNPRNPSSLPIVAILVSESPFTQACLLTAHASPVPFFLLHLPPFASQPHPDKTNPSSGPMGTLYWNAALSSSRGLLGTEFEIRWERDPENTEGETKGRPRLWYSGKRLPNWTPGLDRGNVDSSGSS